MKKENKTGDIIKQRHSCMCRYNPTPPLNALPIVRMGDIETMDFTIGNYEVPQIVTPESLLNEDGKRAIEQQPLRWYLDRLDMGRFSDSLLNDLASKDMPAAEVIWANLGANAGLFHLCHDCWTQLAIGTTLLVGALALKEPFMGSAAWQIFETRGIAIQYMKLFKVGKNEFIDSPFEEVGDFSMEWQAVIPNHKVVLLGIGTVQTLDGSIGVEFKTDLPYGYKGYGAFPDSSPVIIQDADGTYTSVEPYNGWMDVQKIEEGFTPIEDDDEWQQYMQGYQKAQLDFYKMDKETRNRGDFHGI